MQYAAYFKSTVQWYVNICDQNWLRKRVDIRVFVDMDIHLMVLREVNTLLLGSPNYGPRMPGIRPAIVYFDYIVKFTM
jgi:hypothetical protein